MGYSGRAEIQFHRAFKGLRTMRFPDPSLQSSPLASRVSSAFFLKRAVSQRLRASLKRCRNASSDLGRVTKTTQLRPTIRFRGGLRRDATRLHQPSKEMQMPFFVRSCNNGKTFELRIKHGRLPKPAAPSAHCGVASPTRGTTLRQRLGPRGCATLVGLATDVPLWGVCSSAAGGLPAAVSSPAETARGNPPSMRARALVRARSAVSCAMYSAGHGKDEEHHSVTYRLAGSYAVFRVALLYAV